MKISLIGAELEENLGLRYMASALERDGHEVDIVPFNSEEDVERAVRQIIGFGADIARSTSASSCCGVSIRGR